METKIYRGEFDSWGSVRSNFALPAGEKEPDAIFAVYDTPPYEGYATVVFRRGDQWFEASGTHCSCYGLEDQWEPELINPAVHLEAVGRGKYMISMPACQDEFNGWLKAMTFTGDRP